MSAWSRWMSDFAGPSSAPSKPAASAVKAAAATHSPKCASFDVSVAAPRRGRRERHAGCIRRRRWLRDIAAKPDRRRALELLAACHDGATEALMIADGFNRYDWQAWNRRSDCSTPRPRRLPYRPTRPQRRAVTRRSRSVSTLWRIVPRLLTIDSPRLMIASRSSTRVSRRR